MDSRGGKRGCNDRGLLVFDHTGEVIRAERLLRAITLAPVLLAGLIGCLPLLIPCVTCRCCKELLARARAHLEL